MLTNIIFLLCFSALFTLGFILCRTVEIKYQDYRLAREEVIWQALHDRRGILLRQKKLIKDWWERLFKFWIPLGKYEEQLGTIWSYYPTIVDVLTD